jgi:hypothetical protein
MAAVKGITTDAINDESEIEGRTDSALMDSDETDPVIRLDPQQAHFPAQEYLDFGRRNFVFASLEPEQSSGRSRVSSANDHCTMSAITSKR